VADIDPWCEALIARHTASLSTPEFLKAVRALSARYVESRGQLPDRSPLDSAGKRAAFAAFYAPLHFVTTREIVSALEIGPGFDTIVDLGCGTGVASAAWSLNCATPPAVRGIDRNAWTLTEASWNWRQLGLRGKTERGDLVVAAERLASSRRDSLNTTGVLLGWSANELSEQSRRRLLGALVRCVAAGATVVVIEPIARAATPWWPQWVDAFNHEHLKVRTDDWKFEPSLPPRLAELREGAGLTGVLSARTMLIA
jgi:hypothetical protein